MAIKFIMKAHRFWRPQAFVLKKLEDIHHTYRNDGTTALHWAAFCGLNKLVEKLINSNASIDKPDNTYKSTPLGWAIHCLQMNDANKTHNQLDSIKLLLNSGADTNKLIKEKNDYLILLGKNDSELKVLLN